MVKFLLRVVSTLRSESDALELSRAGVEYHTVLISVVPRMIRATIYRWHLRQEEQPLGIPFKVTALWYHSLRDLSCFWMSVLLAIWSKHSTTRFYAAWCLFPVVSCTYHPSPNQDVTSPEAGTVSSITFAYSMCTCKCRRSICPSIHRMQWMNEW